MKVSPFGAALRWQASNHHMLRWLKTVVVSDVAKARVMRQVGIGKTVLMQQLRPLNDAAEARHVDERWTSTAIFQNSPTTGVGAQPARKTLRTTTFRTSSTRTQIRSGVRISVADADVTSHRGCLWPMTKTHATCGLDALTHRRCLAMFRPRRCRVVRGSGP